MFDWDEHNTNHVRESHVEPEEVEDALSDFARIGMAAYNVSGERRWALLGGVGDSGRILFIVYAKRGRRIRVVTAREAGGKEKRRYRDGGK